MVDPVKRENEEQEEKSRRVNSESRRKTQDLAAKVYQPREVSIAFIAFQALESKSN
jgi:hypothetical protein